LIINNKASKLSVWSGETKRYEGLGLVAKVVGIPESGQQWYPFIHWQVQYYNESQQEGDEYLTGLAGSLTH
jgi:hypothetical protein